MEKTNGLIGYITIIHYIYIYLIYLIFFLKSGYRIGYNQNWPVIGTPVLSGSWFRFRFPKTMNWGTPVPVPGFGQKPENRTGLAPLIVSGNFMGKI
jgi:hypothetical protein